MADYADLGGFEFAGVKFSRWQTESGMEKVTVESGRTVYPMNRDTAVAIHAFIEAENDEWRWTNYARTEARRGRWVAIRWEPLTVDAYWAVRHDDFPGGHLYTEAMTTERGGGYTAFVAAAKVLDDFLAWKSAQEQPEEPTGMGAVVEAGGMRFVLVKSHAHHPWIKTGRYDAPHRFTWDYILQLGPVTILSPGVDA